MKDTFANFEDIRLIYNGSMMHDVIKRINLRIFIIGTEKRHIFC